MAIDRTARAVWTGDLRSGQGRISSAVCLACGTGVDETDYSTLKDTPYTFATRFENVPGTSPEELLASAHAACYSMALSLVLGNHQLAPTTIETRAMCSIEAQSTGGFKITHMRLKTRAEVPGIDDAEFQAIAQEAEAACPVSNALRGGVDIELTQRCSRPRLSRFVAETHGRPPSLS